MRGWICLLWICLAFCQVLSITHTAHGMLLKILLFALHTSPLLVQALQSRSCLSYLSDATTAAYSKSRSKLCYDRQSVVQSTLVSSTHLGLKTRFFLFLSDSCGFVNVGCPHWWVGRSVFYNVQCIYILHVMTWMYIQYRQGTDRMENIASNSFSIVAYVSVVMGMCLLGHCLAMTIPSHYTIHAFTCHITIP
jgi:hypothetical protein